MGLFVLVFSFVLIVVMILILDIKEYDYEFKFMVYFDYIGKYMCLEKFESVWNVSGGFGLFRWFFDIMLMIIGDDIFGYKRLRDFGREYGWFKW